MGVSLRFHFAHASPVRPAVHSLWFCCVVNHDSETVLVSCPRRKPCALVASTDTPPMFITDLCPMGQDNGHNLVDELGTHRLWVLLPQKHCGNVSVSQGQQPRAMAALEIRKIKRPAIGGCLTCAKIGARMCWCFLQGWRKFLTEVTCHVQVHEKKPCWVWWCWIMIDYVIIYIYIILSFYVIMLNRFSTSQDSLRKRAAGEEDDLDELDELDELDQAPCYGCRSPTIKLGPTHGSVEVNQGSAMPKVWPCAVLWPCRTWIWSRTWRRWLKKEPMVADAFDMSPSRIMLPKNVDVENVCRGRSFPYPFLFVIESLLAIMQQ